MDSDNIIKRYQAQANYEITDLIQQVDMEFDMERLRREIFDLIDDNDHGFNSVVLRGHEDNKKWEDCDDFQVLYDMELLELRERREETMEKFKDASKFQKWHPGIREDSYLPELLTAIQEHTGFNITNVTMVWTLPGGFQDLHRDIEPMRFHIPIVTNKDVMFLARRKAYYMDYGKLYHIITTEPHAITNYGLIPRLHLIFSVEANQDVLEELADLASHDHMSRQLLEACQDEGVDEYSINRIMDLYEKTGERELTAEHHKLVRKKDWIDIVRWIKDLKNNN